MAGGGREDLPLTESEEAFERETGKKAWLPTYSEKWGEHREYLNQEYIDWHWDVYYPRMVQEIKERTK